MIAVTFALPAESSDFIRRLQDRKSSSGGINLVAGFFYRKDVVVLHTGAGAVVARERIATFLDEHSPDLLISAGFAGALTDELKVGDLLLAKNFSTPALLPAAEAALSGSGVHIGTLTTAETTLHLSHEREAVARSTGAVAVDMETAIVAEACAASTVPMLSLRVVSDSTALPFPAPPSVLFDLQRQKTNLTKLCFYLARHPTTVGRLIAFARRITVVRRSLADALEVLVREARV